MPSPSDWGSGRQGLPLSFPRVHSLIWVSCSLASPSPHRCHLLRHPSGSPAHGQPGMVMLAPPPGCPHTWAVVLTNRKPLPLPTIIKLCVCVCVCSRGQGQSWPPRPQRPALADGEAEPGTHWAVSWTRTELRLGGPGGVQGTLGFGQPGGWAAQPWD